MDKNRKRKADTNVSNNGASKRQKLPATETAESTTESGLRLVESLKNAKDKNGRHISELFLTLPNKKELPEYYDIIKLPIAIDTVEKRLRRHDYSNLTGVESDFKRMVANAKQFNDEKSIVYGDAERVRKLLSNWMKANNPAYNDPDYSAFATPIPGEDGVGALSSSTPDVKSREKSETGSERPRKTTITLSRGNKTAPVAKEEEKDPPPEAKTAVETSEANEFAGMSFQQAQEAIVRGLIDYVDDDESPIYEPFVHLPPRSLADYYQVIKYPVSLNIVEKKTQGKVGREAATGNTIFKSWDAYESEVANIWNNARTYNEDGSEMYELAEQFEEHFKRKLELAKTVVDEPQGPKISLKARPKPTIHLGAKGSPAPLTPNGVAVDGDALARQKELVQAGVNGRQTPQPQRSSAAPADTQMSDAPALAQSKSQSGTIASPSVKGEVANASPMRNGTRTTSTAPDSQQLPITSSNMPPPARVPSASPHPQALPPITSTVPAYAPATVTFVDEFSRLKPVSQSLLPTLSISTHPQLHKATPLSPDIKPNPDFTHQSLTIQLDSNQYYLQLTPTVSSALISGRQYKLFVTVNGTRVSPSSKVALESSSVLDPAGSQGINGVTAQPSGERKQVYDAPLNPGVNRIEVEIVAATGKGGALETEKISVFANLMRA